MTHEWHPMCAFCVKCGAALQDVVNGHRSECNEGLIAISHRIAARHTERIMTEIAKLLPGFKP